MKNLNLPGRVAKALLHQSSQFANALATFAKNRLGAGGHDDHLGAGWSTSHFHTGIAVLSKFLNLLILAI